MYTGIFASPNNKKKSSVPKGRIKGFVSPKSLRSTLDDPLLKYLHHLQVTLSSGFVAFFLHTWRQWELNAREKV